MEKFLEKLKNTRLLGPILKNRVVEKFLNRETILYVIVGVLTTLVDYFIFTVFNEMELMKGADAVTASSVGTALGWLAAVIFAYFANKKYVFRSNDYSFDTLLDEIPQFFGARILSGVIVLILMRLLVDEPVGMNAYLAKILTSVFNLVFNYFASKLVIFKKKPVDDITARRRKRTARLYTAAFLIPVFIVTVIYICGDVWPVGNKCFMKTDMYHQYIPFLSEFRHKLVNGESLFFSWDVGLGTNFAAVYAYYLASPLNWLVFFVSESHVIEFLNVLTIIKIGLCSVTFTRYLRGHTDDMSSNGPMLFGIVYALSGYMCAYYWNTMWLDCIILFPLIIGALEKLVKEGKMFGYAALLGLCIISNYYISIMICIFLVLYFAALNVLDLPDSPKEFLNRCVRFATASLAAGAVAAVMILPALSALRSSASASSSFPKDVHAYFSVVEMLARMQPCVQTEQVLEHWPNIYSGTFVFLLFPLYLMARRIRVREKAVYVCLALIMLASFSINGLDYIWHGFHTPNSLPCRQSFCFVFLALFMAYRAYQRKEYVRRKELGIALVSAAAFLLFVQKGEDTKYFDVYVTWISLILVGLYALILGLYSSGKLKRSGAYMAALILVVAELTANAAVTSFTTCSRIDYVKDNNDIRYLVEKTQKDTDFFRYEKGARKTKNDGAWLNFPSVSLFSSTANADCTKALTKLGCEASTNAYSITGSTPLVDMLLNVKYYLSGTDLSDEDGNDPQGRTLVERSDTTWLYENSNVLSAAYVIPEKLAAGWAFDFDNPALVQNSICDSLAVPHVLRSEKLAGSTGSNGKYSVTVSDEGDYYAYITTTAVKSITVMIGGDSKNFDNVNRKYLVDLGHLEQGDLVTIASKEKGEDVRAEVYRFDYDTLELIRKKLAEQQMTVTGWNAASMEGTVRVDPKALGYKDGKATLMFTVPYDAGWRIYANGEQIEAKKGFGDAFLCAELAEGSYDIRIEYVPEGIVPGLFVTLAGLLALAGLFLLDRRQDPAQPRRRRRSSFREEPVRAEGPECLAAAEEEEEELPDTEGKLKDGCPEEATPDAEEYPDPEECPDAEEYPDAEKRPDGENRSIERQITANIGS